MKSKVVKVLFVLAITFILGGTVGALITQAVIRHRFHSVFEGPGGSHGMVGMIERRLARDYDLTPDQRDAVTKELQETAKQMEAFRRKTGPQIRAILDGGIARIESHLTPEQKAAFQRDVNHRFNRWNLPPPHFRHFRPGEHHGDRDFRDKPPPPPPSSAPPPAPAPEPTPVPSSSDSGQQTQT